MITPHFNAIKARIENDAALTGKVFDTVRIDDAGGLIRDNYVILYRSGPDSYVNGRLTAVSQYASEANFIVEIRAVGTSTVSCGAVTDKVMNQLIGHILNVPGRVCSPITKDSSNKVITDQSVKPFLYYQDSAVEFVSSPA